MGEGEGGGGFNAMRRDATQTIELPVAGRKLEPYRVREPRKFERPAKPFTRIAYAAAHVVADPWSQNEPWLEPAVDWDATVAFRRHLWSWGLGVAEAMDTAQRGAGMDWPASLELVRRTLDAAKGVPGAVVGCGAGTDQLAPEQGITIERVIAAYEEQCAAVEKLGGRIVLMASRALAACARSPEDYGQVYDRVLAQVREPVIIHWLGEMFDPALEGYWGHGNTRGRWRSASTSSGETRRRSTASKSRFSTRTRRSPCGAGCRRACACIPETTSISPS